MDILAPAPYLGDDELQDDRPPQSLWAKLDHVEVHDGHTIAVLDAIDADWFGGHARREPATSRPRGWLTRPGADSGEWTSILAVAAARLPEWQAWYRVELGGGRRGSAFTPAVPLTDREPVALQYDSLLGLGVPRPLESLRPATRAEAQRLGAAGSLADDEDASADRVADALSSAGNVTSAAVFDVGQGGWNALLEEGRATLLFDLGGGVVSHRSTFPSSFDTFCFEEEPSVVLSHWDWDHWSSAVRFPIAQSLTWIVPRQGSLGPTHARFLGALRENGIVVVFPRGSVVTSGDLDLQQAAGRTTSKNETGLALLVRRTQQAMLFPGDAGYATLDLPGTLTSVVVPHHGGKTRSTATSLPSADGSLAGRAVFTYSDPNYNSHPAPASVALHADWAAQVLNTKDRGPRGEPGHVELHWSSPASATAACCRRSALPLRQR
jgi:beta-lactamase superfamily II metal-dependent hydrolase